MQRLTPLLLASLALIGCASGPQMTRVDDGLLADVEPARMEPVREARALRDAANDTLALTRRRAKEAEHAVDVARADLDVASAEVDRAIARLRAAQHGGSTAAVDDAEARLASDEQREITADLALTLAKRKRDLAGERVRLSEARWRLSDARVELAKGVAVEGIDSAASQAVSLAALNEQAGAAELDVQKAESRVAAKEVKVQEALNAYDASMPEAATDPRTDDPTAGDPLEDIGSDDDA